DEGAGTLARLHAVWGADQLARLESNRREPVLEAIRPLLGDEDPTLRAAAAKALGERMDGKSATALVKLLGDSSPRVQYFACLSLARLQAASAMGGVIGLIAKNENRDPAIRHAGVMYLKSLNQPSKISALRQHPSEAVRLAAVVALRRLGSGELASFLSNDRPAVVAEAARAIHDTPVPVAMSDLAGLIDQESLQGELIRRVLNANFRLGTAASAEGLGKYAARISAPPEMRIESLRMLADWASPDPRDRVINAYRPLAKRDPVNAAKALEPHIESLMNAEDAVREAAIEVAASLGIRKIAPMLAKRFGEEKLQPKQRANALISLARLDSKAAVRLAKQVKILPTSAVVPASLKVLADHDLENSIDRFIEATESRDTGIRQLAWDILSGCKQPKAKETIRAAVNGFVSDQLAADVQLNVLEAAKGKLDESLQAKLDNHLMKVEETDPLGKWLVSLEGGDIESGKRLFFENTKLSCVRCHKVDRAGGEVGPELTSIGKQKDRRYLLESICLPNAQVAKGYETAVIADDFGNVFTGIVKAETDDFIELIQNDGSQVRVLQEEIIGRRKGQSSMPNDLVQFMTPRELRDLIAYLASLQASQRGAGEVE
ncbi:MAG: HEAT repeat domain-containing protein, partial [Planctomycetota bacterium]